jgi:O-acetyl-ADP-ribose deacetylase (regulator of RNase III)
MVDGDLLNNFDAKKYDGIAHGCNCFYAMASGIAADVRLRYIEAYKADLASVYGSTHKLGLMTLTNLDSGTIFNLYTQYKPGRQEDLNQLYENIRHAFRNLSCYIEQLKKREKRPSYTLGVPFIGAGIAGGDWKVISKIIAEESKHMDVVFVNYVPGHVDLFVE